MSTLTLKFGTTCYMCLCNRCHSRSEKENSDVFIIDQLLRFCSTCFPSHRLLLLLIVQAPFIKIGGGYPEISRSGSLCYPQCMIHRDARTLFYPPSPKKVCVVWVLNWYITSRIRILQRGNTYLQFSRLATWYIAPTPFVDRIRIHVWSSECGLWVHP